MKHVHNSHNFWKLFTILLCLPLVAFASMMEKYNDNKNSGSLYTPKVSNMTVRVKSSSSEYHAGPTLPSDGKMGSFNNVKNSDKVYLGDTTSDFHLNITITKPKPPPPRPTPIAKFSWPAIQKIMVSTRRYSTYKWKFFKKSISGYSTVYISSPCGNTRTMKVSSNPFETKSVRMCGSTVSIRRHGSVTTRIYISAGSL